MNMSGEEQKTLKGSLTEQTNGQTQATPQIFFQGYLRPLGRRSGAGELQRIFEAINSVSGEARLRVERDRLTVRELDPGKVSLIEVFFPRERFMFFEARQEGVIVFDPKEVVRRLSIAKSFKPPLKLVVYGDSLSLSGAEGVEVKVEAYEGGDVEALALNGLEAKARFNIDSYELFKTLKNLYSFDEAFTIEVSPEKKSIVTIYTPNLGMVTLRVWGYRYAEPVKSSYRLDFALNFLGKAARRGTNAIVELLSRGKEEGRLFKITVDLGVALVSYYQAPRIE